MTELLKTPRLIRLSIRFSTPKLCLTTLGLVFLLLSLPLKALALGPIILPSGSFDQTITPYTSIYEDESNSLTVEEILLSDYQLRFTPSHTETIKRGTSDSTFWLRVSIHNPLSFDHDAVLTLSNTRLDSVIIFDISDPHLALKSKKPSLRGSASQAHAFTINVDAKNTDSYLIRVQTDAFMNTRVELKSLDQFNRHEQFIDLLTGTSLGWILAALLYFSYAKIQGNTRLASAGIIYTLSVLVFIPAAVGIGFNIKFASFFPRGMIETAAICMSAIAQLYAIRLLGWRHRNVYLLLSFLMLIQLGVGISQFWLSSYVKEMLISTSIILNEVIFLVLLKALPSRMKEAQNYLWLGALVVCIGILLVILNNMNLIVLDITLELIIFLLPLSVTTSILMAHFASMKLQSSRHSRTNPLIVPEVMAQISHELRTPINGVIGMFELLNDTPLSVSQRDYLETINMAGNDMMILVNEVADLGKLKLRDIHLDNKPVRVSRMLNNTLSHFQQEAIRKQVELILDLEDDFPERLICDRSRLQIIVYNLISRTLAYTEHGGLAVSASYYRGGQTQGLRLQIQLSGTVIKQSELTSIVRVLQPGAQNIDEDDPRIWNLIVVRGLIRQMRGTLDIENMTNHGGSLTLFLPMEFDSTPDNARPGPDTSLMGLRVLVIDDNASLRNVIEKQLKRWGMIADSTYSGKEALAMLRTQCRAETPYDMIVIDHDMPVMSGLQLSEKICNDDEIPVKPASLMLTGLSISSVQVAATAAGIDHVIAKPASGNRLREALAELKKQKKKH